MQNNEQFNHYLNQLRNLLFHILKKNRELFPQDMNPDRAPVNIQIFVTLIPCIDDLYDDEPDPQRFSFADAPEGQNAQPESGSLEYKITQADIAFLKEINIKF